MSRKAWRWDLRLVIAVMLIAISIGGNAATNTPENLARAYDIAQTARDMKRTCRLAGQLADAYLDIADARTYEIWKAIEDKDCAEYERSRRVRSEK
jgi:hypothetical protein